MGTGSGDGYGEWSGMANTHIPPTILRGGTHKTHIRYRSFT